MPFLLRALLILLLAAPAACAEAAEPLPVHVGGRAVRDSDGAWHFGWPGVYFESRFHGSAVTVAVESETESLRLSVDGAEQRILVRPGTARITLSGLPEGEHVVRLDKLTESQTGKVRFLGFFAGSGTAPLDAPARARRIEFIGDSLTVGYGNTAPGRTCTREQVHDTTDTTRAFGPILARRLDADYRVNAFSGFGIVRNYAGGVPDLSLPAIYPRMIPGYLEPVETGADGWRPQLVVVNLGSNDFSTPVRDGERWPDAGELRRDYRDRYVEFVRGLIERQPQARFILMSKDDFIADVEWVAARLDETRSGRVTVLRFGGLENDGCDWHPGLADHVALADLLERTIAAMNGVWD